MPTPNSHGTNKPHTTGAAAQGGDRKSVEPIRSSVPKNVNILHSYSYMLI